jgi:membrane-associated phospholipid phosphatase
MNGEFHILPPWRRLLVGIIGAAVVSVAFFPIYLGGAATSGILDHRLHLFAAWELALPFWPPMIVPYLSMFLLFLLPPLQLDEPELAELVRRLIVASLIGGAILLCLPSEIGFTDRHDAGVWQPIYDFIYAIDSRANAVPSFHVIYTTTILLAFIDAAKPKLRIVYLIWLFVVCVSTVLTHRHHLLDVAGGLAIAFGVRGWLRRRAPVSLPASYGSSQTGVAQ